MAPCGHRHVVVHRRSATQHRIRKGDKEVCCTCDPGLMCPVCDWDLFQRICFTVADDDLVDQFSTVPPGKQVN